MLRALWIWQRWIAAAEPKVRWIASWHRRVEPARDQVVQQGLNRCGVLGRPFHQRQRMLVAFAVNPDRGDQHEIVAEMQPVDLDHQKVERGERCPPSEAKQGDVPIAVELRRVDVAGVNVTRPS